MSALRLARGVTGRDEGHQVRRPLPRPLRRVARRRRVRRRRPGPVGLRRRHRRGGGRHHRRPLEHRARDLDDDVAVVCVEPVAANMGLVPAREGLPRRTPNAACDRVWCAAAVRRGHHGVPRRSRRRHGAHSGSSPDVWCFGKVIGGGLPVGAFGASAEIMSNLAPLGERVPGRHALGEPAWPLRPASPCSAELTPTAYEQLIGHGRPRSPTGLAAAFAAAGVAAQVPRVGPLVGLFFGPDLPVDYDTAKRSVDLGQVPTLVPRHVGPRGIALAPGPYEVMFPSLGPQRRRRRAHASRPRPRWRPTWLRPPSAPIELEATDHQETP